MTGYTRNDGGKGGHGMQKKKKRGKGARIGLVGCIRMICNGMRARFGARGHTFNFAGPITKSDMHHSEINSQQRTHVLFVMSRSKLRADNERGIARKMSAGMVAGSGYLSSELPVNDNPWSKPLPCLSHVYQLSLPFRIFLRPSFVISFSDFASLPRHHPTTVSPLLLLSPRLYRSPPTYLNSLNAFDICVILPRYYTECNSR